jgi:diguanylate cyclase (GGDEF)-like protein
MPTLLGMPSHQPTRRGSIARRFWLVLGVLAVTLTVLGVAGFHGLYRINAGVDKLEATMQHNEVEHDERGLLLDLQAEIQIYALAEDAELAAEARARVDGDLSRLEGLVTVLNEEERTGLERITELWQGRAFDTTGTSRTANRRRSAMTRSVKALLDPLVARADHDGDAVGRRAAATADEARATYRKTRRRIVAIFLGTMLLGFGLFVWLIRGIVPRTRSYSAFAGRVAEGDLAERLRPRGGDELSELGRSLDDLATRHEGERDYRLTQGQFVDAMQVTASEEEAHSLIKRHLERSISLSKVVVLGRNNSDDRLEARTPVEPGSALAERLDGARPRSCLAVRFGRRHQGGEERDPLLSCEVCGKLPGLATCSPLLVGGEVIGAVLVNHEAPLDALDDQRARDSVSQSAAVLANLRNLAIAEMRASTDALTGLPNSRAVQDTLKRMVAQASRSQESMAVALLDLDHFKQINDTYGHGRGDEVLAAVAQAMKGAVRSGDFVGRYGGEEFVIALPDTDLEGALTAAEKIRFGVAQVTLPSIERLISASLGVAVLPADGLDTETLLRNADRALYDAKSKGRNRVECAGPAPRIAAKIAAALTAS